MTQPVQRVPLVGFSTTEEHVLARDLLLDAGYCPAWFQSQLGVGGTESLPRAEVDALARRLTGSSRIETLVRSFWMGLGAPCSAVQEALAPMPLDAWIEAGLLVTDAEQCFAAVKLQPFHDLVIASDPPHCSVVDPPSDWVMGVGMTTRELLAAVVPGRPGSVLDAGTGSGVVGIHAGRSSQRVVALDVNPRALAFATFNARLNGARGFSCRLGSIFEGVGDERFDLVLSNPPFVVAPDAPYTYRSVARSTTLCRDLLHTLTRHLAEGGICQFICDWPHATPDGWRDEVVDWALTLDGIDTLVQRRCTRAARDYATTWIRFTESQDEVRIAARLHEWTSFYEIRDIRWITSGSFTLRRRTGARNWIRCEDSELAPLDGPAIASRIAQEDAGR